MRKKLLRFVSLVLGLTAMNAQAQYCTPSYPSYCMYGDDINDFVLTGSGINHTGTGCSAAGYGDYTSTPGLTGNLESTVTYNFSTTHNYPSQHLKIWIDFNNDFTFDNGTELLFSSTTSAGAHTGSITIPVVTPINNVRMRVMCSYYNQAIDACTPNSSYGETHDYNVNILPMPTCPQVSGVTLIDVAATTAEIDWTEPGTATDYIIEWGAPGFLPGVGAELGTANVTGATDYIMTGLTPNTTYDYYIRTDCGIDGFSYWSGPYSFTTPCVAITTLPWNDNFETAPVGTQTFPSCWVHEKLSTAFGWNIHNNAYAWGDADALNGTNFLAVQYNANAVMWTPEFELTGGETYEFIFWWAGDTYTNWDGEVLVSTNQAMSGGTVIGDKFVENGDPTSYEYTEEVYCYTPATDGTYSFGIHVIETGWWYYLAVDSVTVRLANPSAGTSVVEDICQTAGLIDMNDIASITDPFGTWSYSVNPSAIVDDTLLNTTILPAGTTVATYDPKGCLAPDVTITMNIQSASSAGNDGVLSACMNQQVDLLGALSGNVNLGGTWYDDSFNPLTSSYFLTGTTPGDYDYTYVATNGVCPSDSAVVTLTIDNCDYLTTEIQSVDMIQVYPNPAKDVVYISVPQTTENFSFIITDINGRVVVSSSTNLVSEQGKISTDISQLEDGVYMVRVLVNGDAKVFRLVKN